MYTPNLHIATLYDTTFVKVVGALREKIVNTPSVCNKNRAYYIQCTGARRWHTEYSRCADSSGKHGEVID